MDPDRPLLNNGAVACRSGVILAVGPASKLIAEYPGHEVCRLNNTVLMPGLINVHTHLELPPLLDAIRAKTFPEWVMNLIIAKKSSSMPIIVLPQERISGPSSKPARPRSARYARTASARLISNKADCVQWYFMKSFQWLPLDQGNRVAVLYADTVGSLPYFSSLLPPPSSLLKHGISPHAPHTVSEGVLLQIRLLSKQRRLHLSMHVAESQDEIRLLQRKKNGLEKLYQAAGWDIAWAPEADSPFDYLHRLGLLSRNFLAVHAVQATDRDISLMKKSRTPVAHCPRSNKETGVGKMALKKFLDAAITIGLGTDSLASSPSLNLWDEMRYALRVHKNSGISAWDIFTMATIGGAKALGMEKEIGSLEPGKKADIIAVPLPEKNTGDIYSDLLRETKSCIMSMVNGKIIHSKENV